MQKATVRVRLNKVGSDVPLTGVTPAEAMVLHIFHQSNNGGSTFGEDMDKIYVDKDKEGKEIDYKIDHAVELNRLFSKYGRIGDKKGNPILNVIFPDKMNPKLPEKYSDLKWANIQFDGSQIAAVNIATGQPVVTAALAAGAPKA